MKERQREGSLVGVKEVEWIETQFFWKNGSIELAETPPSSALYEEVYSTEWGEESEEEAVKLPTHSDQYGMNTPYYGGKTMCVGNPLISSVDPPAWLERKGDDGNCDASQSRL